MHIEASESNGQQIGTWFAAWMHDARAMRIERPVWLLAMRRRSGVEGKATWRKPH